MNLRIQHICRASLVIATTNNFLCWKLARTCPHLIWRYSLIHVGNSFIHPNIVVLWHCPYVTSLEWTSAWSIIVRTIFTTISIHISSNTFWCAAPVPLNSTFWLDSISWFMNLYTGKALLSVRYYCTVTIMFRSSLLNLTLEFIVFDAIKVSWRHMKT